MSATVAGPPDERACECGDALGSALVTTPKVVPVETRRRLAALLDRYWRTAT